MWAALRPSPTARVMSVGPWTASPAAKTCGTAVWPVAGSATSRPLPATATRSPNRLVSGRMPIAATITSHVDDDLAARDRLHAPAAGGVRLAEPHLRAAEAADGAGGVAEDLRGGHEEAEGHAFALGVVGLDVVGRHLVAAAAVGDGHGGGAEPARGPRGVHGDVAAADDDDALAAEVHRLVELDPAQEVRAADDAQAVLARDAEARRPVRAGRDEDGVEAVGLERGQVA